MSDWTPVGAAAKLAYIQTHIANPDKTGYNSFHKFDYIQEHAIFEALRPYLRDLHCAVVVSPAEVEVRVEDAQTGKGKPQKLVTLVGTVEFIDGDEPADSANRSIVKRFVGQGADDLDKAGAKAQTIFTKYALQKFFAIPTEHIEDGDSSDDEPEYAVTDKGKEAAKPKRKPRAKQAPKAGKATERAEAIIKEATEKLDATEVVTLQDIGGLYDKLGWSDSDLMFGLIGVGVEINDESEIPEHMGSLTDEQRVSLADIMRKALA